MQEIYNRFRRELPDGCMPFWLKTIGTMERE